uniref:Uncharacterized protein n=1 Tax=Odontella aurita TaxID=265563 RepID=A0A7S4HK73_9STRA|mmetsp:Transcript_11362/g.33455  ORF Transcript_11362/g.33455 Transcript_11362/m.33455 type:complete len:1065 (+) Transcript_11362:209-3403(+)
MILHPAKNVFQNELLDKPLRHKPISTNDWPSNDTLPQRNTAALQNQLKSIVAGNNWLLEDDQALPLPEISLVDETKSIFTLNDCLIHQEERLKEDVLKSAADERGNRIKPTEKQLEEVKTKGKLTVPSHSFVDQEHIWELSPSFYSGRHRNGERFNAGLGNALDHIVVREKEALVSTENMSVVKALKDGVFRALHFLWTNLRKVLPIGIPLPQKYSPAQVKILTRDAETLYINFHIRKVVPGYCHHKQEQSKEVLEDIISAASRGHKYFPENQGVERHLQQHTFSNIHLATAKINKDLERRKKRELDIDVNMLRKSPLSAIREGSVASDKWDKRAADARIKALWEQDDPILRAEASRLYVKRLKQIMELEDLQEKSCILAEKESSLKAKRKFLSMSPLWMRRNLEECAAQITKTQQRSLDVRLLKKLHEDKSDLAQNALLPLELSKKFRAEEAPGIETALQTKKITNTPMSIMMPKWFYAGSGDRLHKVVVQFEQPFWRFKIYYFTFVAAFANLANGALRFFLSGPLSLRALFAPKPFYASNGKDETLTPTLISRLNDFFKTLRKVRSDFERTPDLSLVGKSIQRAFLNIYLAAKGTFGSILISTFMTFGSILMTTISASALILSPLLAAVFILFRIVFDLVIYDCLTGEIVGPLSRIIVGAPFFLLIPGGLQALGALGLIILHPVVFIVQTVWSSFRFGYSSLRDTITWSIIRRHVRIPAADTFLARRVHGPGLSSEHLFHMPLQQAYVTIQAFLDLFRLRAYFKLRRSEILTPSNNLRHLVQTVVRPFGYQTTSPQEAEDISSILVSMWHRDSGDQTEEADSFAVASNFMLSSSLWSEGNHWDDIARRLRTAHPRDQHWLMSPKLKLKRFVTFDKKVSIWLEGEKCTLDHQYATTIGGQMSHRAGKMLAKLILLTGLREQRLVHLCALPPQARSKFRLLGDELQVLWKATVSLVQQYADGIRNELTHIANNSEQNMTLVPVAHKIADTFWTNTGAKAGEDVEIVAARVLSLVFGGDQLMLEPMEEVDKRMLLIPKTSEEDKHLDFFSLRDPLPEYVIPDEIK